MHDNTAAQNDSPMPQPLGWGGVKRVLNLRRPPDQSVRVEGAWQAQQEYLPKEVE